MVLICYYYFNCKYSSLPNLKLKTLKLPFLKNTQHAKLIFVSYNILFL